MTLTHHNSIPVHIKRIVIETIFSTIASLKPEQGGILGYDVNGVICDFHQDINHDGDLYCYVPNIEHLNDWIENVWEPQMISYAGMVHSHLPEIPYLSEADYRYAEAILSANSDLEHVVLLLVVTRGQQEDAEISSEIVFRDKRMKAELILL